MYGLSLLGVTTIGEQRRDRAAAAGQRAVNLAQRIKKTAPRLAAAVERAGQKALAVAGVPAKPPEPTPPPNNVSQAAPDPKGKAAPGQKVAAGPKALPPTKAPPGKVPGKAPPARTAAPPPTRVTARRPPPPVRTPPARSAKGTRVGEEGEGQVDVWTSLADASMQAADFVFQVQDLMAQMPPELPLVGRGQNLINNFEFFLTGPIEAALSGAKDISPATQDVIEAIRTMSENKGKWFAQANAWLQAHPPAPKEEPPPPVVVVPVQTPAPETVPPVAPPTTPPPATPPPATPPPPSGGGGGGGGGGSGGGSSSSSDYDTGAEESEEAYDEGEGGEAPYADPPGYTPDYLPVPAYGGPPLESGYADPFEGMSEEDPFAQFGEGEGEDEGSWGEEGDEGEDLVGAWLRHRTLIGEFDIAEKQRQMNTLRRVPVCVARALLKGGLEVAAATIRTAQGGLFERELPGITTLKKTQAHLQWHAAALAKLPDPTAIYVSGDDLKKWVMQAFIDSNAVEEGRARQDEIWRQMWSDIGTAVASLPADVAQAAGALTMAVAGGLVEGVAAGVGVPSWVVWAGGTAALGLLGLGAYRIILAAAPIAVGAAARRYLP